ncbi:C-type lectin domain family 4 member A-like [Polypterus senegalus]|uniref:C-type lectin domain family 4 member A-like n=1 Tax=Polypterus senegalus TaxID=55291 RepID=UPI001962DC41|nr:C-type lectin domain family 4 member A-like [Polypterus senegalus]
MDTMYASLDKPTEDYYNRAAPTKVRKAGYQEAPVLSANVNKTASWFKALLFLCFLLVPALVGLAVYHFTHCNNMGNADNLKRNNVLSQSMMCQKCTNYTALWRKYEELNKNYSSLQMQYDQLNDRVMTLDKVCPLRDISKHGQTCSLCPKSWLLFTCKCYFFSTDQFNWNDSQENCISKGGHLVIIQSKEEQDFLTSLVNSEGGTDKSYWIGLTDQVTEGHFLWVDNKPLDKQKQFWAQRESDGGMEPNNNINYAYSPNGENCVALYKTKSYSGWHDVECRTYKKRICEAEPSSF